MRCLFIALRSHAAALPVAHHSHSPCYAHQSQSWQPHTIANRCFSHYMTFHCLALAKHFVALLCYAMLSLCSAGPCPAVALCITALRRHCYALLRFAHHRNAMLARVNSMLCRRAPLLCHRASGRGRARPLPYFGNQSIASACLRLSGPSQRLGCLGLSSPPPYGASLS
jgi:hypothetical protein